MSGADVSGGVTLAVIAGGAGTRMGGSKHRLHVGGRAILVDLLERCAWEGPTMLVVGADGGHVEGQERVGAVVADPVAGQGPLLGMLTALEQATTDRVAAVPIDMPGLRGEHLRWLVERAREEDGSCVLLRRSVGKEWTIEPFPAVYRRSAAGMIRRRLEDGRRSLRALAEEPQTRVVYAPLEWDDRVWSNLNTGADVVRFTNGIARLDRGDAG
jgi:molybdopterin-guanine dinucleotide biosynthesis protein A